MFSTYKDISNRFMYQTKIKHLNVSTFNHADIITTPYIFYFDRTLTQSIFAVVDPQFPIGGTNPKGGGVNLLFLLVFPKNCTKMKFLTDVGPPEIKTDSLSHTL